jgi:hypothetical protein
MTVVNLKYGVCRLGLRTLLLPTSPVPFLSFVLCFFCSYCYDLKVIFGGLLDGRVNFLVVQEARPCVDSPERGPKIESELKFSSSIEQVLSGSKEHELHICNNPKCNHAV